MPVADSLLRAQVPMISGSATNPKLTTKSPYIFRTIVSNSLQNKVLGSYIANILNYDNMAILYTNDNYSISFARDIEETYELASGTITLSLEPNAIKYNIEMNWRLLRETQPEALFLPNLMTNTSDNTKKSARNSLECAPNRCVYSHTELKYWQTWVKDLSLAQVSF